MTKGSKKAIVAFLGLVAVFGLYQSFATAAENNLLDALGGGDTNWAASIVATGPTATNVKIEFPLFSVNGEQLTNYAVNYVKDKSFASADLSDIKEEVFDASKITVANNMGTITLENLVANSTYYFVVTPINKEGTKLDASNEGSFTTTAAGNTTDNENEVVFGAADTSSANITYTTSGSKVTIKWKSIAGASKFVFSMKEASESAYKNVGEELISKESFSFVVGQKGLYSVKIVPVDAAGATAGAEKVISVKIEKTTPVDGKGTPATGAGLNLILMSTFLLMLIYVVYRFRTTN